MCWNSERHVPHSYQGIYLIMLDCIVYYTGVIVSHLRMDWFWISFCILWERICLIQAINYGKNNILVVLHLWAHLSNSHILITTTFQGPVVQSIVSLMSSLRVISLTVLADSIYNILIFFAEKMWVAFAVQKLLTFFQQKISAYLRITRCKF